MTFSFLFEYGEKHNKFEKDFYDKNSPKYKKSKYLNFWTEKEILWVLRNSGSKYLKTVFSVWIINRLMIMVWRYITSILKHKSINDTTKFGFQLNNLYNTVLRIRTVFSFTELKQNVHKIVFVFLDVFNNWKAYDFVV